MVRNRLFLILFVCNILFIGQILKAEDIDNTRNFFGISIYEPTYLGITYDSIAPSDRKKTEVKFQISLKKRLLDNIFGLDEEYFFAYSQTSWWQIFKKSSPFRENSYRPEFFVKIPIKNEYFNSLSIGLLHESNGKDGLDSRSWNRVYTNANVKVGNIDIIPRFWMAFLKDKTNYDITKYMGYYDLRLNYNINKHLFSTLLRSNFESKKGAVELSYQYHLNNGLNLYCQYFNGYGENLMDYYKRANKFLIGLSLSY